MCDSGNIFDDGLEYIQEKTVENIKEMSKESDIIDAFEERIKLWMKRITEVLKESEQIRKENDSAGTTKFNFCLKCTYHIISLGPQDELEYWKKRCAQLSQIISHLEEREVQLTILCLQMARSKNLKIWQETSNKITFCYNEAKDNAKFIQAMEKNCHSLYLDDPVIINP